ncbi:MAG: hypothetical protein HY835_05365 [Anaerolineae bacterium]|nr:hypothetical protein [Anaerolineae bacterium]
MTPTARNLKPNDVVCIKYDVGEFYADFPSQVILSASRGSQGRIVSMEEFKIDFIRRLRGQQPGPDQQMAYLAHFAVVEQAMALGLQYPIRFEKVAQPANPADLLRARPQSIVLVDGSAVEKQGGAGFFDQVTALFGQPEPKPAPQANIHWPPSTGIHDSIKFTDLEVALAMAHKGPAVWEDIEIVYLRYTSLLPYHNLWYRLKQVDLEAALDIVDTLHFPKHNHAGLSWKEIAAMIKENDPRKPLWYTLDQKGMLITAVQRIYQMEQERGAEALANFVDPEVLRQMENNPDIFPGVVDKHNKKN